MAASLVLTACGDDNPTESDDPTTPAADESADDGGTTEDSAGDTADAGEDTGDAPVAGAELSGTLAGAGASSQDSAMAAWVAGYNQAQPGVTVNYDGVGSGGGREQLIAGAIGFAGSDAYLDEEESEAVKEVCGDGGAMNIPVYISPVAIPYNVPGVDTLNLSPSVLAQIFNQEITTWNDPAIAEINPDADLPEADITVVNRSDESGTTENFMEYLSAVAAEDWEHEADKVWPVAGGEAAQGTTGVITVVGSTENSIGYADASAVGSLTTALVGVGEEFVAFSPDAAAKVVDASEPADTGVEGDLALDLARDTTESGAYPIVLVSYHIVCSNYSDAAQGDLVKDFIGYVISEEGQAASAEAAGSAPISPDLRAAAQESLDSITAGK
ncbi:phosphate ABC transporter substrate-binding protein PstS [Ornithinimicrobium ciconiae]|uniref:Phosphate-binding protein n=2 Tax=Ornithinimicrobium ciconiae TaxID=2594265 RepID=A0A516GF98_9MICO|nr:phosphate ABC transporter substrate-binding protein PstS [Ornithinimicrobium ciconiae]